MKNPLLVPEIRDLLSSNDLEEIIDFLTTTPPPIVADFLGALSAGEIHDILSHVSPEIRSSVFGNFDDDIKLSLIERFENGGVIELMAGMHEQERLNFFRLLSGEKLRDILDLSRTKETPGAGELAEKIEQFIKSALPPKLTPDEVAFEVLPHVQIYSLDQSGTRRIAHFEKNTWINIVNPSTDSLPLIARHFNVPLDFLTASLDIDETARIEVEDGASLIIIKVPYFDEHNSDVLYVTLPIGVILTEGYLITVCSKDEMVLNGFVQGKVRYVSTLTGTKFILQIILRATMLYLQYLKQINNAANLIQKKLEQESKNEQLIKLLNIEKSLVYFTTSLKSNSLLMERYKKFCGGGLDDELEELFDDITIENRQALEMSNIYSDILSGMMDAFASVISNNLNIVMKVLTSITIILTIPVLITSIYGMNIQVPFQHSRFAFIIVMAGSLAMSVLAFLFFIKKKWM